jgi:hypothetical protein
MPEVGKNFLTNRMGATNKSRMGLSHNPILETTCGGRNDEIQRKSSSITAVSQLGGHPQRVHKFYIIIGEFITNVHLNTVRVSLMEELEIVPGNRLDV